MPPKVAGALQWRFVWRSQMIFDKFFRTFRTNSQTAANDEECSWRTTRSEQYLGTSLTSNGWAVSRARVRGEFGPGATFGTEATLLGEAAAFAVGTSAGKGGRTRSS